MAAVMETTVETKPETAAAHFTVRGRVQGVGFRYAARAEAERLGVSGWVANRPGGEVEALAVGAAASIDEFAAWLRVGPPHARVDRVERIDRANAAAETTRTEPPAGFQIRV